MHFGGSLTVLPAKRISSVLRVEREIARDEQFLGDAPAASLVERMQTRFELLQGERLDEIVVGAALETL